MSSEAAQLLKQKLAITPKTASLLIAAGYKDYRDLRTASPSQIIEQFSNLPGMTVKQAESYRRGLRRMVWLATQDDPEEKAKLNPDWTKKALEAKGAWSDDYDELSGEEVAQRLDAAKPFGLDSVVQAILNYSTLEVEYIRITNATQKDFDMFITVRVLKTGPVGATLAPMVVDMIGPKGTFGKLQLPEVKTKSSGITLDVPEQKIEITDMDAFLAFVRSIQHDEKVTMMLDNGKSTIKALGLTSNITYKKKLEFAGMNGPKTEILKTEDLGDGKFKNTMKMTNPSPVEIDLGTPSFVFKDASGNDIAEQSGKMRITRGNYTYENTGSVKNKGDTSKVILSGVDTDHDAWTKKSVQYFELPVTLTPELQTLAKA